MSSSETITKEEFWTSLVSTPISNRTCENCGYMSDGYGCVEPMIKELDEHGDEVYDQTCNYSELPLGHTLPEGHTPEYIEKFYNKYGRSLPMWKPKR